MDTLQHKCGVAISVLLKDYQFGCSQIIQSGYEALTNMFAQAQYVGGCKGVGRNIIDETAVPCAGRFSLFAGCCKEMCCISARPRSFNFQSFSFIAALFGCMLSIVGQYTYIADHLRF